MSYKPTPQQEKIIYSDHPRMLVSASAGTGKTGVMTDRIVRLIREGKAELNEILVVTFTKAAAVEMKERLFDKLSELAETDVAVCGKLALFDTASIGTIHSFCSELIRTYFYVADIDPSFTIMEPSQANTLKKEIAGKVFERYYRSGDQLFRRLTEIFGGRTHDALVKEMISVGEFAGNIVSFGECAKLSFEKSKTEKTEKRLNMYGRYFREKAQKLRENALPSQVEYLNMLIISAQTEGEFPESVARAAAAVKALPIPRLLKAEKGNPVAAEIQEKLKLLKKNWLELLRKYSVFEDESDAEELLSRDSKTFPLLDKLTEVYEKYAAELRDFKYGRGMLEFSDLESLALKILNESSASEQIRNRYKYVFVDEYQDVNDVQEQIISRLGNYGSLFLVGDVKQSIYGFRMSDPRNFLKRRNDPSTEIFPLTVNFRSHKKILEFVNDLFSECMSEEFGGSGYSGESVLSGLRESVGALPPVSVIGIDDKTSAVKVIVSEIAGILGTAITSDGKESIVTPGSIAVLARTKKDLPELFAGLRAAGIPVSVCYSRDLWGGIEIRTLISFLKILDNPFDDVHLYAALSGFFGGFTPDELCDIRLRAGGNMPLYQALAGSEDPKVRKFLGFAEEYRLAAYSMPADRLISRLVLQTDYRGYLLTLPDGINRCALLDCFLIELTDKPECRDLGVFLKYLEEGEMKGNVDAFSEGDSVKLMTIHAAKGLEFPVVILMSAEARFNKAYDGNVICDKETGLAMKYYREEDKSVLTTLKYFLCRDNFEYFTAEEELRLLYVALTRAKDMLIITCSEEERDLCNPVPRASCFADWLAPVLKEEKWQGIKRHVSLNEVPDEKKREIVFGLPDPVALGKAKESLAFVYPYGEAGVPVKITATGVKDLIADAEENNEFVPHDPISSENAKDGFASERGTAYHKAMEILPFLPLDKAAVERCLRESAEKGEITQEQLSLVSADVLSRALCDKNLSRLLEGASIYREKSFLVRLPFSGLVPGKSDAPVILQGIMDLIAVKENEAAVIDFKFTRDPAGMVKRYAPQLKAYKTAAESIFKNKKVKAYLYSLATNEIKEIK